MEQPARENKILIGELREDIAKLRQTTAMIKMDIKYIIELLKIKEADKKEPISNGWFK